MQNLPKCQFPEGMTIKPDGIHELDPCVYELVEEHRDCDVYIYKCQKCGHQSIEWKHAYRLVAHWVDGFICSNCNNGSKEGSTPFCPYCGYFMDNATEYD